MPKKPKRATMRSICLSHFDLVSLINGVCLSYREIFEQQQIAVEMDVPDNLRVDLDPILMRDAFRKVIDNSLDAMPDGGCITITSLIGRFGLEVEFADTGRGIPEEMTDRLFEPFTTTKEDHAGLGLSMVREIASVHQGSITVTDCPEGGTAFTFLLPFRNVARRAA